MTTTRPNGPRPGYHDFAFTIHEPFDVPLFLIRLQLPGLQTLLGWISLTVVPCWTLKVGIGVHFCILAVVLRDGVFVVLYSKKALSNMLSPIESRLVDQPNARCQSSSSRLLMLSPVLTN